MDRHPFPLLSVGELAAEFDAGVGFAVVLDVTVAGCVGSALADPDLPALAVAAQHDVTTGEPTPVAVPPLLHDDRIHAEQDNRTYVRGGRNPSRPLAQGSTQHLL